MQRAVHCGSGNATGDKRLGWKEIGSSVPQENAVKFIVDDLYYLYSKDLKSIYIKSKTYLI